MEYTVEHKVGGDGIIRSVLNDTTYNQVGYLCLIKRTNKDFVMKEFCALLEIFSLLFPIYFVATISFVALFLEE